MAVPYRNFKEKIRIINKHKKTCYIEDLDDYLYIFEDDKRRNNGMEIRCKGCNKLLGKIQRAEDCVIEFKCNECGLKLNYNLRNL